MGLDPITEREQWPPGHRLLSLAWPRPLRICAAQAQSLSPSCTGGWLALRLSSLGVWLECCAWGESPLGSKAHPSQQAG